MKFRLPIFILASFTTLLSQSSKSDEVIFSYQTILTVQIASFPETSISRAFKLCDDFKKENQFVYLAPFQMNRQKWNRVKVGAFQTREEAVTYRDTCLLKDFPDALVVADSLHFLKINGKRMICTMQDIWLQNDSLYQTLYAFDMDDSESVFQRDFVFWEKKNQLLFSGSRMISKISMGDTLGETAFTSVKLIDSKVLNPNEMILPSLKIVCDTLYYSIAKYDSSFHKIESTRDMKIILASSIKQPDSTSDQNESEPGSRKRLDPTKKSIEDQKKEVIEKKQDALEEFLL